MRREFFIERRVEAHRIVDHEVVPRIGKKFATRLRRVRVEHFVISFKHLPRPVLHFISERTQHEDRAFDCAKLRAEIGRKHFDPRLGNRRCVGLATELGDPPVVARLDVARGNACWLGGRELLRGLFFYRVPYCGDRFLGGFRVVDVWESHPRE